MGDVKNAVEVIGAFIRERELSETYWGEGREAKSAAELVAALDAAGYAVVPKEPTDEMLEASVSPRTVGLTDAHIAVLKDGFAAKYRAMISASQVKP